MVVFTNTCVAARQIFASQGRLLLPKDLRLPFGRWTTNESFELGEDVLRSINFFYLFFFCLLISHRLVKLCNHLLEALNFLSGSFPLAFTVKSILVFKYSPSTTMPSALLALYFLWRMASSSGKSAPLVASLRLVHLDRDLVIGVLLGTKINYAWCNTSVC